MAPVLPSNVATDWLALISRLIFVQWNLELTESTKNFRTTHLGAGCGGGNDIKDGGERVDGAKHRRISHGLAGVQRVGVRDSAGWP